jgi:hypothetical protein
MSELIIRRFPRLLRRYSVFQTQARELAVDMQKQVCSLWVADRLAVV